jgi:hypothetical protein
VDAARRDERDDLDRALDLLFGANRPAAASGDGWRREVREAFRRRALDTHPDRAVALGRTEASMAEEFRQLLQAYQVLSRAAAVPPAARRATGPRPAGRPPQDHLHRGALPQRPLLFAEYLYYSGRVSWRNLVEAIAWQRRQRPAIGRIAVVWGHLSEEEVREILDRRRRDGAAEEPFGAYACRNGFLSAGQLLALLGRQRRHQRRIGEYFVEAGIVAPAELRTLDADLTAHNARWRRSA